MPPTLPPSARRLRAALAPADARTPSDEEPQWDLQRRHAEGGAWFTVDQLWTEEGAVDWVLGPPVAFDHGDLLRLRSPGGRLAGFWVQGRGGLVDAGLVPAILGPHGRDWAFAWEGPEAEAHRLAGSATLVDRRRLVLVACDAAEGVLSRVPSREPRPRAAVEAARAWALSGSTVRDPRVRSAMLEATAATTAIAPGGLATYAVYAAYYAVCAADVADTAQGIASAAAQANMALHYAAMASGGDLVPSRRALVPLVHRWIPLPVLLLSRAGEPTPLSLEL